VLVVPLLHGAMPQSKQTGSSRSRVSRHSPMGDNAWRCTDVGSPSSGGPLEQLLFSVMPDEERLAAVEVCLEHMRIIAQHLLGESAAIVVQGSYAQGLSLRGSDLDVVVITGAGLEEGAPPSARAPLKASHRKPGRTTSAVVGPPDTMDRRRALALLHSLADALTCAKSPEIRIALRIFRARVPVLRLHFRGLSTDSGCPTGRQPRIVVDVSAGGSLRRGECDRCVHAILERDASGIAAAFCRMVKLWAKRRRLTNTLGGGLSSFAFVLLGIFFLQHLPSCGGGFPESVRLPSLDAVCNTKDAAAIDHARPPQHSAPSRRIELQLAQLLASFFHWAKDKLPKYGDCSLSVATGRAELRCHSPGGLSRRPLVLEVPGSPTENAARCLRMDIWKGAILPEIARACSLAQRIVEASGGRARKSPVRLLFAPAGALGRRQEEGKEEKQEEEDVEEEEEQAEEQEMEEGNEEWEEEEDEEEVEPNLVTRAKGDVYHSGTSKATFCGSAGFVADPTSACIMRHPSLRKKRRTILEQDTQHNQATAVAARLPVKSVTTTETLAAEPLMWHRRKRRRKDNTGRISLESSIARPPQHGNAQGPGLVAPVERWLGLRAMLNPVTCA